MSTSKPTPRPLKQKPSDDENYFESGRNHKKPQSEKRNKSENLSQIRRYLICCCHLLYVKSDPRGRDEHDNLIPLSYEPLKATAPTSAFSQLDMVETYFDCIDRTVVSQSKA